VPIRAALAIQRLPLELSTSSRVKRLAASRSMRRVVIPPTCWPSATAGNTGVATSVIAAGLSEATERVEAPTIVAPSGIRRTVAAPAAAPGPNVNAPAVARIRIEEVTFEIPHRNGRERRDGIGVLGA
jgi:hypothetical protein